VGVKFEAGDILIDARTGDIGLLIERFDVLEYAGAGLKERVWAWDMIWTGKHINYHNRYTPYTEGGLVKCIKEGLLIHLPGN
jgi:hypothetical protein